MISRDHGRERDPLVRAVLFPLGQLIATRGAIESIPPSEMMQALRRHARGDWGDIDPEDRGLNEQSLKDGSRLLSVYHAKDGTRFWIITEADRAATTVLLPEEY